MSAKSIDVLDHDGINARINPQTGRIDRPGWLRRYLVGHWEGQLPLAQAFGLNTVALSLLLLLFEAGAVMWIWSHAQTWWLTMAAIGAYAFVRLLLAIWQVVGSLRTAALLDNRWARLVQAAMVLIIPALLALVVVDGYEAHALSRLDEHDLVYVGSKIELAPAGDAVDADGMITPWFVEQVERRFAEHPSVRRLRLDSSGGELSAALALGRFLSTHADITVEVDDHCAGRCALAFLEAGQRLVTPDAVVTFKPEPPFDDAGLVRHLTASAQRHARERLQQLGATSFFIDYAFGKDNTVGYAPSAASLLDNHAITGVWLDGRVLDGETWRSEQFLYAMRTDPRYHDVVHALDTLRTRYPAIFRQWLSDARTTPVQSLREPSDTALLQADVRAIDKAFRIAVASASAESLRAAAVQQRNELDGVRTTTNEITCGQYAYGVPTLLGQRHPEFFFEAIARMDAMISAPSPQPAPVHDADADLAALQDARDAVFVKYRRFAGDPYATACQRQIALLDSLSGDTLPAHTMALRALMSSTHDPRRIGFLMSP